MPITLRDAYFAKSRKQFVFISTSKTLTFKIADLRFEAAVRRALQCPGNRSACAFGLKTAKNKALTFISATAYRYEINALQLTRRQAKLYLFPRHFSTRFPACQSQFFTRPPGAAGYWNRVSMCLSHSGGE
ncbi:hypothetical protein [Hominenteromicrobium sp.]